MDPTQGSYNSGFIPSGYPVPDSRTGYRPSRSNPGLGTTGPPTHSYTPFPPGTLNPSSLVASRILPQIPSYSFSDRHYRPSVAPRNDMSLLTPFSQGSSHWHKRDPDTDESYQEGRSGVSQRSHRGLPEYPQAYLQSQWSPRSTEGDSEYRSSHPNGRDPSFIPDWADKEELPIKQGGESRAVPNEEEDSGGFRTSKTEEAQGLYPAPHFFQIDRGNSFHPSSITVSHPFSTPPRPLVLSPGYMNQQLLPPPSFRYPPPSLPIYQGQRDPAIYQDSPQGYQSQRSPVTHDSDRPLFPSLDQFPGYDLVEESSSGRDSVYLTIRSLETRLIYRTKRNSGPPFKWERRSTRGLPIWYKRDPTSGRWYIKEPDDIWTLSANEDTECPPDGCDTTSSLRLPPGDRGLSSIFQGPRLLAAKDLDRPSSDRYVVEESDNRVISSNLTLECPPPSSQGSSPGYPGLGFYTNTQLPSNGPPPPTLPFFKNPHSQSPQYQPPGNSYSKPIRDSSPGDQSPRRSTAQDFDRPSSLTRGGSTDLTDRTRRDRGSQNKRAQRLPQDMRRLSQRNPGGSSPRSSNENMECPPTDPQGHQNLGSVDSDQEGLHVEQRARLKEEDKEWEQDNGVFRTSLRRPSSEKGIEDQKQNQDDEDVLAELAREHPLDRIAQTETPTREDFNFNPLPHRSVRVPNLSKNFNKKVRVFVKHDIDICYVFIPNRINTKILLHDKICKDHVRAKKGERDAREANGSHFWELYHTYWYRNSWQQQRNLWQRRDSRSRLLRVGNDFTRAPKMYFIHLILRVRAMIETYRFLSIYHEQLKSADYPLRHELGSGKEEGALHAYHYSDIKPDVGEQRLHQSILPNLYAKNRKNKNIFEIIHPKLHEITNTVSIGIKLFNEIDGLVETEVYETTGQRRKKKFHTGRSDSLKMLWDALENRWSEEKLFRDFTTLLTKIYKFLETSNIRQLNNLRDPLSITIFGHKAAILSYARIGLIFVRNYFDFARFILTTESYDIRRPRNQIEKMETTLTNAISRSILFDDLPALPRVKRIVNLINSYMGKKERLYFLENE